MAYTQSDLDNIERAIIDLATNRRAVKFVVDGDVVQYSLVELPQLRALRNEVAGELARTDSSSGAGFAFVVHGGKGL